MASSHSISAWPGRRENSPASQAILGEPKFEIPGNIYIEERSVFLKNLVSGALKSKKKVPIMEINFYIFGTILLL